MVWLQSLHIATAIKGQIMGGFRRFIIGLADFVTVLGIVGVTIVAAFWGYTWARMAAIGTRGDEFSAGVFGILLGGGIGFCIAALAAAFLFTLSEIAANTRDTVVALRSGQPVVEPPQLSQAQNTAIDAGINTRYSKPSDTRMPNANGKKFLKASDELSDMSVNVLN